MGGGGGERLSDTEGGRKGDAPSGESDADADGRTDELMM